MERNLLTQLSEEFSSLVADASSRVVQVTARHWRPASGTVVGNERVLVAVHALDRERGAKVRDAAGTVKAAEFLGLDVASNLAVLHVPGLAVEPFSPSAAVRVGEIVVALGRTWSGALAASAGIVSVIGGPLRTVRGRSLEQVLRADVRVHPLGAGGPLVDASGRVAGIATGGFIRGLPLFVPASIAWATAEAIASHGSTKRGYLGIGAQPVRIPEGQRGGRSQEIGLLVTAVADGSPAAQAGVLVGDVIVGFDGERIEDHDLLLSLLFGDRVGKALPLELLRAGELRTVSVTVGERQ